MLGSHFGLMCVSAHSMYSNFCLYLWLNFYIFMHLADTFIQSDLQCIQALYTVFRGYTVFLWLSGRALH